MTPAIAASIMQDLRRVVSKPVSEEVRLHSFSGINRHEDLIQALTCGSPFTLLGTGHFAAVFEHASYPDYAFKVGFKKEDSGAMYAAWCRDNKLPHTPEIIHMDRWEEAYMVCMPKYFDSWSKPYGYFGKYDDDALTLAMSYLLEPWDGRSKSDLDPILEASTLGETILRIRTFFQGIASMDIHAGNWMLDKDGEIIITDPVSFTKEKTEVVKAPPLFDVMEDVKAEFDRTKQQCPIPEFPKLGRNPAVINGDTAHLKAIHKVKDSKPSGLLSKLMQRFKFNQKYRVFTTKGECNA